MTIILFFLISFLILISTIGYGLAVTNFLNIKEFNYNYGLIGILGLFILSIISSYTHLFSSHNFTHNIIIYFVGLISFVFFNKKKTKHLNYISLVFFFNICFNYNV